MSRSKKKGTAWESAIVKALKENAWPHAERRALNGAADRGDIAGIPGVVIEAKNTARADLPGWWREAVQEQANDKAEVAVVWFKRHGKTAAEDGWVAMDGRMFMKLLRLAGW